MVSFLKFSSINILIRYLNEKHIFCDVGKIGQYSWSNGEQNSYMYKYSLLCYLRI